MGPVFTRHGENLPTWSQVKTSGKDEWAVPDEAPAAFVYNGRNHAVMLTTPDDLEDFAVGFTLTEQIVDDLSEIRSVDIHCSERGVEFRIKIDPGKADRFDILQKRRNMAGRAGCGMCGLDNAEVFFQTLPTVGEDKMRLVSDVLTLTERAFSKGQPLKTKTKSVHGAAWVSLNGDILQVREDIGRHNALDKLLGAMAREASDVTEGFVMMSSRCSYELIEKAARRGIKALATISAPTSFAIRKAREANIALYCRSKDGYIELCTDGILKGNRS